MNTPKQHHYVPEGYLRHFTDADGFLCIFDGARDGPGQWRRQRPSEVMKRNAYYRQPWARDGVSPNILEEWLGGELESKGLAAFEKIKARQSLGEDEAAAVFLYLEFQRIRVPRQEQQAEAVWRWWWEQSWPQIAERLEPGDRELIETGQVRVAPSESLRFEFYRHALSSMSPFFSHMAWRVITSDGEQPFLTSDSPVTFWNEALPPGSEPGVGLAGTVMLFPLDSTRLLALHHPVYETRDIHPLARLAPPADDRTFEVDHGEVWSAHQVASVNRLMWIQSGDMIVGSREDSLRAALEERGAAR